MSSLPAEVLVQHVFGVQRQHVCAEVLVRVCRRVCRAWRAAADETLRLRLRLRVPPAIAGRGCWPLRALALARNTRCSWSDWLAPVEAIGVPYAWPAALAHVDLVLEDQADRDGEQADQADKNGEREDQDDEDGSEQAEQADEDGNEQSKGHAADVWHRLFRQPCPNLATQPVLRNLPRPSPATLCSLFPGLRSVRLHNTSHDDLVLDALPALAHLEALDISNTFVASVAPLARCTRLRAIDLHGCTLAQNDLGALADAPALRELNVLGVDHAHALARCTALEVLSVSIGADVLSSGPLCVPPRLHSLTLGITGAVNMETQTALLQLEACAGTLATLAFVRDEDDDDDDAAEEPVRLSALCLCRTSAGDAIALPRLSRLQVRSVHVCHFEVLLAAAPTLREFECVSAPVDASALLLKSWHTLLLSQVPLPAARWLASQQQLTALSLIGCSFSERDDPCVVASLQRLERLACDQHVRLDAASLPRLCHIAVNGCSAQMLTAQIARMQSLTSVELSNAAFGDDDLASLANLPLLRTLALDGSAIQSARVLSTCVALECLDISRSRIRSLAPLVSCARLSSLFFDADEVVDAAVLAQCPRLCQVIWQGYRVPAGLAALPPTTRVFAVTPRAAADEHLTFLLDGGANESAAFDRVVNVTRAHHAM